MSELVTLPTNVRLEDADLRPRVSTSGRLLCEVAATGLAVPMVARFIRARFYDCYGAMPELSIPKLLALTGRTGALLAAVGVRDASQQRLFLESYLSRPVESLIPSQAPAERRQIAEIAHLAGVEPGVSRHLFFALTLWLRANGYDWIVFTGTDQLLNSFRRFGIDLTVLAEARPECLPDGGAGWGSYYDHHPKVIAANVNAGYQRFKSAGCLERTRWLGAGKANLAEVSNG